MDFTDIILINQAFTALEEIGINKRVLYQYKKYIRQVIEHDIADAMEMTPEEACRERAIQEAEEEDNG